MKTRLLDLFLSIGLATVSVSADPAPKLPGCPSAEAIEREAVRAVETARSKPRNCGKSHFAAAKPLRWNPALFKAAHQHAEDMSRKGYFDHNSPNGRSPGDRLSAAGYSWQTYGENIALGQPTVAEVVEGWLGSPEHCGNIMNGEFTEVGVACAASGSPEKANPPYWVMVLAAPLSKSGR
jgi:uncharacterized protein YkwD